ncbi:MAG TPA: flagellar motor switch protein FliM [Candidatus Sumerlaeota bacterium]|nr:MAG: Flagellar motor switch protein FliM [candidate division BRC1 bacterium ADurb.BinA292]HOE96544.1 flagellar motor switch protein FliM [Candidatus Sumerlaeota bacterium]HOR27741.1 flagellar motor switch protein FliM [Candidatus Sumerlaeota bacterium]HPK03248.1 flagellar motor switch protein FliM [Candidatus Sumerlaeota bacterium]
MANVLSQEEIDALLGGISGGQIDTSRNDGEDQEPEAVQAFDFSDQDRYLRGRLPTLETIHDRFARLLRLSLSTILRRAVEIQVCSQTVCNFGDFSRCLEKPSSLHTLKLEPLKGSGLLVLPARLIMTLVDLLFGGDGKPFDVREDRDFTLIESRVIVKMAEDICRAYTESWAPVRPLTVTVGSSETNILFVNIAQPNDPVTVVDCDVVIEGTRSSLSICIPYATIEPIKDILKGTFIGDPLDMDNAAAQRMRDLLLDSTVELRAMLGTATITGRELLQMKAGDIIQLNEDYEHPVEILVEGERKFWGVIGAHKSTRALQITGTVEA